MNSTGSQDLPGEGVANATKLHDVRESRFVAKDWEKEEEEDEEYFGSDFKRLEQTRGQWQSSITLLGGMEEVASQRSMFHLASSTNDLVDSSRRNLQQTPAWSQSTENVYRQSAHAKQKSRFSGLVKSFSAKRSQQESKQAAQPVSLSLGQASKVHVTRLHPSLVGGRQHCFVLTAPPQLAASTPVPSGRTLVSHEENLSTRVIALSSEVHCIQFIKSLDYSFSDVFKWLGLIRGGSHIIRVDGASDYLAMTLLCGLGSSTKESMRDSALVNSFDDLRAPEMPETLALKLVHLKAERPALMDLSQKQDADSRFQSLAKKPRKKSVADKLRRCSRVASLSLSTSNLTDYKTLDFFDQRTVFAAPIVMSTKEFSSLTASHEVKRQTKKSFNPGYLCVDNNPNVPIGNCIISRTAHPNRKHERRMEKSVKVALQEAKNLPVKSHRYFCDISLDRILYARSTSKQSADCQSFWAEHFEFNNLPDLQTITICLYRESSGTKITRRGSLSSILSSSSNSTPRKFNSDRAKSKSELIGYVTLPLHSVPQQKEIKSWLRLRPAGREAAGFQLTHQLQLIPSTGLWDYVDSTPLQQQQQDDVCPHPQLRVNIQFCCVDILPQIHYLGLQTFLLERTLEVTRFLEQILQTSSKEPIARSLVYLHEQNSSAVECLTQLVFNEVSDISETAMLFRQNTFATKSVDHYMKLVSSHYLQLLLGDLIKRITAEEYAWTWEVDPDRMKGSTAGCAGSRASSMSGRGDPKSWSLLSDNQQGTAPWAERVIRSYCDLSTGSLLMGLSTSPSTPCMQSTKLIIAQQLSVSSLTDGQFQAPSASSHSGSVPLIVNQCQLLQFLDLVWRALQLSLPQFPTELMLLFGSLRACLEPIRGAEFCDILISSCLFLRLICPAILAPSLFHLLPSYPSEAHIQRNLTLLAKALQTLANFTVLSDKEPFMRYLRGYIECQIPKMRTFIRLISTANCSSICQSYSTTSTTSSSSHSQKSVPKSAPPKTPKTNQERGPHVDQIDTGLEMALIHSHLCNVFFSENNNLQLPKELINLPQLLAELRSQLNPDAQTGAKLMDDSWLQNLAPSNENVCAKNCTGMLKGESADEIFLVARGGGVKTSNSFNGLENFKRADSSSQIYAVPNTIPETTNARDSHIYDVPYFGLPLDHQPPTSHESLSDRQRETESPIYDSVPSVEARETELKKAPSEPISTGAAAAALFSRRNQSNTPYKRQSPVKINSHRRISGQSVPVPGSYLPINANKRVASGTQYFATNAAFVQQKASGSQRLPMLPVKQEKAACPRPYSSACFPSPTEAANNSSSPSQRSSVVPSSGMNLSMLLSTTPGICSSSQSDLSGASSLSLTGATEVSKTSRTKVTQSPNRNGKAVSTVVIRQLNKNGADSEEADRKPRLSIPGPPPLTASIEKELPQISQLTKDSSNFQTLEQALAWLDQDNAEKGTGIGQTSGPQKTSNKSINLVNRKLPMPTTLEATLEESRSYGSRKL